MKEHYLNCIDKPFSIFQRALIFEVEREIERFAIFSFIRCSFERRNRTKIVYIQNRNIRELSTF